MCLCECVNVCVCTFVFERVRGCEVKFFFREKRGKGQEESEGQNDDYWLIRTVNAQ